ncbi:phage holin family protein [Miltoncostaea marina]|uniref:phage holin family protein n=1 Tax=Miltoncostaea marina TaxID=2843215 RepID=UPI001C3DAA34|nr:phage holin family protein [Miltoncostaea marina]
MSTQTRLRERPIGDLLADFAHETTTLMSQEIELARAEVGIQAKRAGAGAGMFGAAAALALAGLGALTACAILALAEVMDGWLAALIVGAALLVVGGVLALIGKKKMSQVAPPVPERALTEMKRDVRAVQEGVQAGRENDGGGHHNGS